ncbi:hypothetical protein [Pararhizobium sp. O133]|uniref:hypothetical protein n=1 Tax=Pararhizobium sp. O133 TaxID=3449278 RepID=UPI003F688C32
MPDDQTKPGATVTAAEHTAAVAKATSDGHADGFKAANERMTSIFSAEAIKGDGKRMSAAFDLANGSPGMSADAVVAFVSANVEAGKPGATAPAQTYEQQRLAASSLATPPGAGTNTEKPKGGLSAAVSSHIATLKRPA